MNGCDERLQKLLGLAEGKHHAQAALDELVRQREALEKKAAELNYVRMDEQGDVDRLEARSIRNLVLGLLGRKEDLLEKERAELAAAILKYDLAKRELAAVKELEYARRAELNCCDRAEEEYETLLLQKADSIGNMGGPDAEEIDDLRRRIARMEAACAELTEAIHAGRRAEDLAQRAMDALDSAGTWSTIDLFGGGIISDVMKYDRMDAARECIEKLQGQLRLFSAELADAAMLAQGNMNPDGMFRFADFYFDGIFTSVSARECIARSRGSVDAIRSRLYKAVCRLEDRLREEESALSAVKSQLRNKVIHTKV